MSQVTLYPAANSDNCYWWWNGSVTTSFNSGNTAFYVGGSGSGAYYLRCAFRFPSVNIPNGATITSAILTLNAYGTMSSDTIHLRYLGNAVDNAVAPTTGDDGNGKAITSAHVDYDPGHWTAYTSYDSPDLTTIIQEIVNRSGWASGNALMMLLYDNGTDNINAYRTGHTYAFGIPSYYPKLVINYGSNEYDMSISESLTLTDSISSQNQSFPSISEELDITDGCGLMSPLSVSDTFDLGDSADYNWRILLTEVLNLAETLTCNPITLAEILIDTMFVFDTLKWSWSVESDETLTLTDSISNVLGILISDWLTLIDDQANNWNGREIVPDTLNLYDISQGAKIYADEIDESLGIADTTLYSLTVTVLEYLGFTELVSAMKSVAESINDGMALTDSADRGFNLDVEDTLLAIDASSVVGLFLNSISESLGIADAATVINNIGVTLNDPMVFTENVTSKGTLYSAIYDALVLNVTVELAGEVWECYVLNTPKFQPSMYSGFNFNSYCVFENRAFGANDDGIYELTGDTDSGNAIHTGAILSNTDFNSPNQKRFRRGYLGITGSSPIMILETEDGKRQTFAIDARGKTVFSSELKSKKWKLSIADFNTLDHVKLIPVILTK